MKYFITELKTSLSAPLLLPLVGSLPSLAFHWMGNDSYIETIQDIVKNYGSVVAAKILGVTHALVSGRQAVEEVFMNKKTQGRSLAPTHEYIHKGNGSE